MIKSNKGDIKIKGEIDKVIFELKDIFEGAIEVFRNKTIYKYLKKFKTIKKL